ncbi:MAG: FAD binding domain-containing protein [Acidimicrobiales bacterium]
MSVSVAHTLDEALALLAGTPSATVLAGGTDLMVELNMGHRRTDAVVCVNRVRELRTWRHDPTTDTLTIGAGVTYAEIADEPLAGFSPALAQAARTVGSPQIRHAATIGGNVGTASPAGDGLPVLAALDAVVHLASVEGTREVPFAEFATGPKRTVRRPGELITGVSIPVLNGFQGYAKVGVRNAMVIATASACLAVDTNGHTVRLALGSVGPVILRAPEAERIAAEAADFEAGTISAEAVAAFGAAAEAAARPIDDHRSSAAYRRHAIGVLSRRLLTRAFPGGPS